MLKIDFVINKDYFNCKSGVPSSCQWAAVTKRAFLLLSVSTTHFYIINLKRSSVGSFFIDVKDFNVTVAVSDEKSGSEGIP